MQIEKITRAIPDYAQSRSNSAGIRDRLIYLSLPRVKWLESDPEMAAKYPIADNIPSLKEVEFDLVKSINNSEYFSKDASLVPMRNCERRVYNLRVNHKMTNEQVSRELKIGRSTARHYFASAANKVKEYYDNLETQEV